MKNNKHWNEHLQNAWNKYGKHNFEFEIIEKVDNENNLERREQCWIDFYNAADRKYGYNIAPRADRTIVSEETKKKIGAGVRKEHETGAPIEVLMETDLNNCAHIKQNDYITVVIPNQEEGDKAYHQRRLH